ncbi:MAG: transposase [Acidobacteria bacterium]|nr:MAG: transposase [Acidobacteriota bacterium]
MFCFGGGWEKKSATGEGRRTRYGRLLANALWEKNRPLLPKRPLRPRGGRRPAPDRKTLEGILCLLRSGARRQGMPKRFPPSATCWRRLRYRPTAQAVGGSMHRIDGLTPEESAQSPNAGWSGAASLQAAMDCGAYLHMARQLPTTRGQLCALAGHLPGFLPDRLLHDRPTEGFEISSSHL